MNETVTLKITAKHKKSRNGAQHQCLHCGKKLKGEKGLKMHIRQEHPEHAPAPRDFVAELLGANSNGV